MMRLNKKHYEQAAGLRDQIAAIKSLQAKQSITDEKHLDTDALAVFGQGGSWAVVAVMIRGGRVLGSRSFFPRTHGEHSAGDVMRAFIAQHYFSGPVPGEILVNALPDDAPVLEESLSARIANKVAIRANVRATRRGWVEMAEANAREALLMKLAGHATVGRQLEELAQAFDMDEPPTAYRMFRYQPHQRGANGRLVRGFRQRRSNQSRLPAL